MVPEQAQLLLEPTPWNLTSSPPSTPPGWEC